MNESEQEIINLYVVYSWFIVVAKYNLSHFLLFCCYVDGGCDDDKESVLLFWSLTGGRGKKSTLRGA